MRLLFATILTAVLASSAANASSFVTLPEIKTPNSPSIITLGGSSPSIVAAKEPSIERFGGEPEVERKFVTVSASIIAIVDAPQPIAFENVASIGNTELRKRRRESLPMVIRGGIIGDAFATPAARAPSNSGGTEAPKPRQEVSAPKPGPNTSGPQQPDPPPGDQRMPKSALPPPAPPTGRME